MAAWYLAHDDELLLDIDHAHTRLSSGLTRLEQFTRRRLRDAVADGRLQVKGLWLEPSATNGNLHAVVKLAGALPLMERMIWQSWLGSDLYRARADLMRAQLGHPYPSLLILPSPSAVRRPDATCACAAKHETTALAALGDEACAAWRRYRGPTPWECFGRPREKPTEGDDVTLRVQRWLPPAEWFR